MQLTHKYLQINQHQHFIHRHRECHHYHQQQVHLGNKSWPLYAQPNLYLHYLRRFRNLSTSYNGQCIIRPGNMFALKRNWVIQEYS